MIALDDNIEDHPKFVSLSNDAFALWVRCIGYCRRNLTDGFIPTAAAIARARCRDPRKPIAELVSSPIGQPDGDPLWEEVQGGYRVHDYLDFNPSRADVEAKVEANREKGRRGGLNSGAARNRTKSEAKLKQPASMLVQPEPNQERSKTEAACFNAGSTKTNPDPIRSDPDPIRSEISPETDSPSLPSERARGGTTTTTARAGSAVDVETVLAELQRHRRLAAAADRETAAMVLGIALSAGARIEDVVDAIQACAFDLAEGSTDTAVRKSLRSYVARAKSFGDAKRAGPAGPAAGPPSKHRQPMPALANLRELTEEESPSV